MNKRTKPYSEASEQNREPILGVLRFEFDSPGTVLEIGSGTGQHAIYFASALPHLTWQPTDMEENLPGIRAWLEETQIPNVHEPLALDVNAARWPVSQADFIFSANTTHIISWDAVERLFAGVGRVLRPGGRFCLYGPFNYGGRYTSPSNARFDAWLKARDPVSGIRDFEALDRLARRNDLCLTADHEMPVNNRTLVWLHTQGECTNDC